MTDEEFRHPRLAAVYDALDPDRSDLLVYVELIESLGARRILDVGCGTGTLALMLADRGHDVIGVDVAPASLAVARAKQGAERVHWIDGAADAVSVTDRDLAVLTGNVAQAIDDPAAWHLTLSSIRGAVRPGGHLVFETRDPADRGWQRWTREQTLDVAEVEGVGTVTSWVDVTAVEGPLVTFRSTWVFGADGATLTSDQTLRFREREDIDADLAQHGFDVLEVRSAPDRPGREFVYIARRS